MINRTGKVRQYASRPNGPELENHFILRLPEAQARILREDIRQGQANIKDRLTIQLDYTQDKEDMRNGEITFDTYIHKARLVDLPTCLETWKTIDGKNFYKTADVCQMLMVHDAEDQPVEEESKKKKRDLNKVDKKYLFPHGYTPPVKNVRKRRFRKTLRKKNLDLPDIEKEVKRLLRTDNEAVKVRWEIMREEDENKMNELPEPNLDKLFGELSSSEDEVGGTMNMLDDDEDSISRLSLDDSQTFHHIDTNSGFSKPGPVNDPGNLITEFTSSMFSQLDQDNVQIKQEPLSPGSYDDNTDRLYSRLAQLESELGRLVAQKTSDESKVSTIENVTLKQKFLANLSHLENQIKEREAEIMEIRRQL